MSEQRAMTVLGFIGSHIIGQLLETEVELPYGFERGSNAQALTSDYTEALQRVDVVTHCANPILVKETNPEVMLRGTVDSALHLVKQALDVGVKKMVYCSSLSLHFFDLNRKAAFGATPLTTEDFCSVPLDGEIIKLEGHSDGTMYQLPKAVVERKLGEIAKANLGVEIMTIVPATVFVPFVQSYPLTPSPTVPWNEITSASFTAFSLVTIGPTYLILLDMAWMFVTSPMHTF
ncbi:nad-dependent epimerase dehydratase [Moniliophthora roreri]|nr:nad-dependent epimerase dehydratase [Moniliophthora roreri]